MNANAPIVMQAWQTLVVVLIPLAGFVALLWRTWLKPVGDRNTETVEWRTGIERDIQELRDRMARREEDEDKKFDRIFGKLDELSKTAHNIEVALAGIARTVNGGHGRKAQ